MAVRNLIDHEDLTLTLADLTTPTPVTLVLALEDATLGVDGLRQGGVAQELVKIDRKGRLLAGKRGARSYPTFTLTGRIESLQGATMENFLLQRDTYKTNKTTFGVGQKIYTVDMTARIARAIYDATDDDQGFILRKMEGSFGWAEEKDGVWAVSWSGEVLGDIDQVEFTDPTITVKDKLQFERP